MQHLVVGGVEIAYLDRGDGPPATPSPIAVRLAPRMAAADRGA